MRRKKHRMLSVFCTAMLVLPMLIQPQVNAAATKGVSVSAKDSLTSPAQKISNSLEKQFDEKEK